MNINFSEFARLSKLTDINGDPMVSHARIDDNIVLSYIQYDEFGNRIADRVEYGSVAKVQEWIDAQKAVDIQEFEILLVGE